MYEKEFGLFWVFGISVYTKDSKELVFLTKR